MRIVTPAVVPFAACASWSARRCGPTSVASDGRPWHNLPCPTSSRFRPRSNARRRHHLRSMPHLARAVRHLHHRPPRTLGAARAGPDVPCPPRCRRRVAAPHLPRGAEAHARGCAGASRSQPVGGSARDHPVRQRPRARRPGAGGDARRHPVCAARAGLFTARARLHDAARAVAGAAARARLRMRGGHVRAAAHPSRRRRGDRDGTPAGSHRARRASPSCWPTPPTGAVDDAHATRRRRTPSPRFSIRRDRPAGRRA